MQENRSAEIKVGIVSVLALVLLIAGIILGKGFQIGKTTPLQIKFPNSGGIQLTSPVLVNGVKRGTVSKIENRDGAVMITAEMENIDDLYSDASARISILEVTGGKKVEIFPGNSGQKLKADTEIPGITPPDIADLIAMSGGMVFKLTDLVNSLDTTLQSINSILADGEVGKNIRNTLAFTEAATSELQSLLKNNKENINLAARNLRDVSFDMKSLLQENQPKLSKLLDNVDIKMNELSGIMKKAEISLEDLATITSDVKSITSEIKDGKGLASKIIYDKQFAAKLDSTLKTINVFIRTLHKNGINANIRLGAR